MLVLVIFLLGYLAIVFEQTLKLNKAASALITGILCWTVYVVMQPIAVTDHESVLLHFTANIAGILFFLLGAMTIVELIDAHDGFEVITAKIKTNSKRRLLIIVGVLSFFLSAVLDNLTTSIVMMSLISKIVAEREDRMYFGGMVIIAANAGGAWTPIGDVTTTMLWVGGQISSNNVIIKLILPSLVCLIVPMVWMYFRMKGNFDRPEKELNIKKNQTTEAERNIVFFSGILLLLCVPVFKSVTHLPPFMGILLGLGILWAITEFIHKKKNDEEKSALSVAGALQRVDTPSILFFLGILLAIGALEAAGTLDSFARGLDHFFGNANYVNLSIGLTSAVVDNVPLVAAAQGMYPLSAYPMDHTFWEFLAYCSGTGGSILIIGSAAGVAVMGMEKIPFGWYVKRISLPALLGYFAGALVYLGLAVL